MSPEVLLQLALAMASGAGVYAAIRADLARAIVHAEHAHEAAKQAHGRLDVHIQQHH